MESIFALFIFGIVVYLLVQVPVAIKERTGNLEKPEYKYYKEIIDYFQNYNPNLKVSKILDMGFNITLSDGFSKVTIVREEEKYLFIKFHKYDRKKGSRLFSWEFLCTMTQNDIIADIKSTLYSNSNQQISIQKKFKTIQSLSSELSSINNCYGNRIRMDGGYQFTYVYKDYRGINKFYVQILTKPDNYQVIYLLDDFKNIRKRYTWECSYEENIITISQNVQNYIREDILTVVSKVN